MRLLVIDVQGNALDFCLRAQAAGHEVRWFIRQTPKTEHIGRGLVDVVPEYQKWLLWADVILSTDNTMYLRDLDSFRDNNPNVAVIAPRQETAQWELDRKIGQDVFAKHGIDTIPGKEFSNYDSAIAHVKKRDERFVSKPSGNVEDKALSYVSQSPSDMVYMLERWKKLGKLKGTFILQEFVPGTEMAVGAWFGAAGFDGDWCENFEFKKLMNNDLGVATGEQGTVLRFVDNSKLARKVLAPLQDSLGRLGYVGYVDVNCIIDDEGTPWPLEFTMRPGWPTFQIQTPLYDGDMVQCLADLANGTTTQGGWITDKIAVGVVMSIPDYPYSHLTRKEVVGIPVYGLTPALWKHWHPCEMKMGEDVPQVTNGHHVKVPMPVTAGDYIGVMTAVSDTVKDAALTCYRRLDKLIIPNSPMYRTDIGKRLAKQLPKIQTHGYATGMAYSREN